MVKAEGNTGAYVGGTKGISIPLMSTTGIRPAHTHTEKKATTFDWDAHTPTCSICQRKSGTVAEGVCADCRKVIEARAQKLETAPLIPLDDVVAEGGLELPPTTDKWKVYRLPGNTAPWFAKAPGCPEAPHPAAHCGCKPHKTIDAAYDYIQTQLAKPSAPATPKAAAAANPTEDEPTVDQSSGLSVDDPTSPSAAGAEPPHHAFTPDDDPTYAEIRWAWIEARPHVLALIEALDTCLDPQTTEAAVSRLVAAVTPDPGPGGEANPGPATTPKKRRSPTRVIPQAILDDYTSGMTVPAIAAKHVTTPKRIRAILDAAGIERRDDRKTASGSQPRVYSQAIKDAAVQAYAEGMTMIEVGRQLKIRPAVINDFLTEAGIERRPSASEASANGIGRPNKLSRDQVAEIIRRRAAGETQSALAREFGVSAPTIAHHIKRHHNKEAGHTA